MLLQIESIASRYRERTSCQWRSRGVRLFDTLLRWPLRQMHHQAALRLGWCLYSHWNHLWHLCRLNGTSYRAGGVASRGQRNYGAVKNSR